MRRAHINLLQDDRTTVGIESPGLPERLRTLETLLKPHGLEFVVAREGHTYNYLVQLIRDDDVTPGYDDLRMPADAEAMHNERKKPTVSMVGEDGNSFAILARCQTAMRKFYPPAEFAERWSRFYAEATSGDYDHLLQTVISHFEVE